MRVVAHPLVAGLPPRARALVVEAQRVAEHASRPVPQRCSGQNEGEGAAGHWGFGGEM